MLWYRIKHQVETCVFMTIRQCHTEIKIMQYRRHRQSLKRTRRQEAGPSHLYWSRYWTKLPRRGSRRRGHYQRGPGRPDKSSARTDQPEYTGSRPEPGEAIVVGAIRSAAPWFLTGWAHDVEIEFMIDIGCRVTMLSATVFQRMFVMNREVRSALQICRRWLVSADSSPLMLQGHLELNIVFPGLCCKMLLWSLTLALTGY